MANLYNLEPQPTAKVILNTTSGDIELSLFAKQTPLASRNFLQHCLDGYYTNTIFHRLVPGFIIQGGDPTGTGAGGEAALDNGGTFEDEFHSRLKYNRRGLLGMANEGPDSNGSQFFFTLDATPELQGKNTMFGRVEGDTIYNLMKMSQDVEMESEGSERPLYPTKVTGAEILVNPFEDMVARKREAPRSQEEETQVKKRKKPLGKQVLSFGDDEGEETAPVVKKVKANPKLVAVELNEAEEMVVKTQKKEQKIAKPREEVMVPERDIAVPQTLTTEGSAKQVEADESEEESETEEHRRKRKLDQTNAEIQALKASMKRTVDLNPHKAEKPKSALEAMIPATSTRGRKRGKATDEKGAFNLFQSFKQRLETLPTGSDPHTNGTAKDHPNPEPTTSDDVDDDEEAALCDLHFIANCQSCKSWDEEKPNGEAERGGDDDPGWMAHTLTFAKDTLGKDLEWKRKMEEIEVIDPREKARTIKEEKRKGKERVKR